MLRVQTEVFDRDIQSNGYKFPQGDNGAYAVVPPGLQETDMQVQNNAEFCIVWAEHI